MKAAGYLVVALLLTPAAMAEECAALLADADRIGALRDTDAQAGATQARDGIAAAVAANCPAARVEMHAALADNLNVLGQRNEALTAYGEALALLDGQPDDRLMASVQRRSAIVLSQLGRQDEALERFLAAYETHEARGDRREAAQVAGNVASVLSQMQQFDSARVYLERALAGHREAGDEVGIGGASINLGSLLMRIADRAVRDGDDDTARALREQGAAHSLEALERFTAIGHLRGMASAATNVAAAAFLLGRYDQALEHARQALDLSEQTGAHLGMFTAQLYIGNALVGLGRPDEAVVHLAEAEALARNSTPVHQLGVAEAWVRLEEARGDYPAALERHRGLVRLHTGIADAERDARVDEIQARFESERQLRMIADLEHGQELADAEIRRERQLRYTAFAIAVLLLALFGALFARYRLKVRSQAALEQAARSDELTGLPNRRHIRERIEYEVRRSRRNAQPFTLAMIDVDNFKQVNDEFGHEAGDQLLVAVARRISALVRRQDSVARWGGDEFLLLLPETPEPGGKTLTDKLAASLAANPVQIAGRAHTVVVSTGVGQFWPGMTTDECVSAADAAMYREKRTGDA